MDPFPVGSKVSTKWEITWKHTCFYVHECVHESTITCMFPCITTVSAHFWPPLEKGLLKRNVYQSTCTTPIYVHAVSGIIKEASFSQTSVSMNQYSWCSSSQEETDTITVYCGCSVYKLIRLLPLSLCPPPPHTHTHKKFEDSRLNHQFISLISLQVGRSLQLLRAWRCTFHIVRQPSVCPSLKWLN